MKNCIDLCARFFKNNSIFAAVLILFLFGSICLPNFLSATNISAVLNQYSIIGMIAVGQLLIIITGGIDLSQGAMIGLFSVIGALLMQRTDSVLALVIATAGIVLLGVLYGLLISSLRMPAFIVTFAIAQLAKGIALVLTNAKPITIENKAFTDLAFMKISLIPLSAVIWIALCLLVAYMLKYRRLGKYLYAVGSNEEAARLSGIKTNSVKLNAYILASIFVSVASIFWMARLTSGQPTGGRDYELESIAAVVVGGASLSGGKGTIFGAIAGTLLFGIITSVLNFLGVHPFWQGTAKGVIMLIAVVIGQTQSMKKYKLEEARI